MLRRRRPLVLPQGPAGHDRRRDRRRRSSARACSGSINFVLIAAIIAAILVAALWKPGIALRRLRHQGRSCRNSLRDGALLAIAILSLVLTPERAPRGQRLHLGADPRGRDPVRRHLRLHHSGAGDAAGRQGRRLRAGCSQLIDDSDGCPHEVAYFWLTGMLSAFLDNAPTYLVFFELAGGNARDADGPARRRRWRRSRWARSTWAR